MTARESERESEEDKEQESNEDREGSREQGVVSYYATRVYATRVQNERQKSDSEREGGRARGLEVILYEAYATSVCGLSSSVFGLTFSAKEPGA
jgi:hypothetical protein